MRTGISLSLSLLVFTLAVSAEGQGAPKFYLLHHAVFDHLKKGETFEKRVKKLIKKLAPEMKDNITATIPDEIVKSEISPKPGEKLWLFEGSQSHGTTEPTTFTAYYSSDNGEGDGPIWGISYQIDNEKLYAKYRNERWNDAQVLVSVPADTPSELLPRENGIKSISIREINKILNSLFESAKPKDNSNGSKGNLLENYTVDSSFSFPDQQVDFLNLRTTPRNSNIYETVMRVGKKVKVFTGHTLGQTFQVLGSNYVTFYTSTGAGYCGIEIWRIDREKIAKITGDGFNCD